MTEVVNESYPIPRLAQEGAPTTNITPDLTLVVSSGVDEKCTGGRLLIYTGVTRSKMKKVLKFIHYYIISSGKAVLDRR